MITILNELEKNIEFDNNGFFVHNHNDETISERINELYLKYLPSYKENNFHTTHFSSNKKYKEDILELSKDIYQKSFSHLFNNYKVIFSNLMIKYPGAEGMLPVHADWAYVEESEHTAVSLWIPLIDTNENNGILGYIPRSHLIYDHHRGPNIISPYRKYDQILLDNHSKTAPITHLQAFIYNLKLLHFSKPNLSNLPRIAINITLAPKDASLIHYTKIDGKIHKYENLDSDFFLNYNAHQIPNDLQPTHIYESASCLEDETIKKHYNIVDEEIHLSLLDRILDFIR